MADNLEKVKDVTTEFFTKVGVSNFEVRSVEESENTLNIGVTTDDASIFIGEHGRNIPVFETVLRLIFKKQLNVTPAYLHLDINNYRNIREGSLRELAKKAAHRARFYKKSVALESMPPYERRIIHTELATHPDIKTESIGEGENRRVIVKYVG